MNLAFSYTRQSVCSAEWRLTRSFLCCLPALACGDDSDPGHLNLSHPLLLRASVGTDGATVRAEEIQTGCFPFVLGPVSTTLPHFSLNEGVLRILELVWELPSWPYKEGGKRSRKFVFPCFGMCIICLIFFDKSTELAGWVWNKPLLKTRNLSPWASERWLLEDGYCTVKFHRHHFHIPHWPTSLVESYWVDTHLYFVFHFRRLPSQWAKTQTKRCQVHMVILLPMLLKR